MPKLKNIADLSSRLAAQKSKLRAEIDAAKPRKNLTKRMAVINSRYINILDMESDLREVMEKMEKCLQEQREIASILEETNPMEQEEPGKAKSKMQKKPSKRFYALQEIFSLPEDFYELEDDGRNMTYLHENAFLEKIIIHPERISDELLMSLSFADKSFADLPYHKKLEEKILAIKKIKAFFAGTIPLNIGPKQEEYTGRIMVYSKRDQIGNYGKIMLIQSSDISLEGEESNKKVLILHDNLYSFLRSQNHTIDSLKSKEKKLGKITDILNSCNFALVKGGKGNVMDIKLAIIRNQIKELERFKGHQIASAVNLLKAIRGEDQKSDSAKISSAIQYIGKKMKKIISQKTSIFKHIENLVIISHLEEKNWTNLKKNFKAEIKKLDRNNVDELVLEYSKLPDESKMELRHISEELIFRTQEKVNALSHADVDSEAKKQAYLWSEEDSRNGKETSSKQYMDHQYFEALKQKIEFINGSLEKEKKTVDTAIGLYKMQNQKDFALSIKRMEDILGHFLSGKQKFSAYPYSYIYDIINYEYYELKKSYENNDPILTFRVLLRILLTIKEYDILVFLSRLEGNRELEKISTNDEIKDKFIGTVGMKINSLVKKDFLTSIDFPMDSKTNQKFQSYLKIMENIRDFIEKGQHEEVVTYIKTLVLR